MGQVFFKGWPLALYGALVFFVLNGMTRINGVLFPAIMVTEGLTRETASWPLSLPGAALIFMSPATGFLSGRFSRVTLLGVGVLLLCLGILPCYFSTNIFVLSVFFGLLRGCGTAMMKTTVASLIVTSFQENRSTAMGLATTGIPVSGLVLPLLIQYLLDEYDLKGTFLLLTGIAMQAFIGCVGLKKYKSSQRAESPKKIQTHVVSDRASPTHGSTVASEDSDALGELDFASDVKGDRKRESEPLLPSNHEECGSSTTPSDLISHSEKDQKKNYPITVISNSENPPAIEKKGKFFNKEALIKIVTSRGFYLLSFTHMLTMNLSSVFSQVIVDYLADKGIGPSSAVLMIPSISCGEIAGRLCLGWLVDRKYVSYQNQMATSLSLGALMVVACTYTDVYWLLMACAFVLGIFQGSANSVNLVQVGDYFTKAEVPLAMSFTRAISGVGILTRAPLIGVFRDGLGSYDNLLRVSAGTVLALALAWALEGCSQRRKQYYQLLKEAA